MDHSFIFLYTVFILAISIHIISLIITIGIIIPLQIKEARVKNGLARLRKLMLFSGFAIVTINIASILALSVRFFIVDLNIARYVGVSLVLSHAIGLLAFTIITRAIYKQQYSEKEKKLHDKLDKLEHQNK